MAFTTIQGSGANDATSFVGTAGVDNLVVTTLSSPAFIGAEGDADTIQFNTLSGVVSSVTARGGDGNDTITAFSNFGLGEINGNAGADTINLEILNTASIRGGQGDDSIDIEDNIVNSVVNGNLGNDDISTGTASVTLTNSSIYGGKGNDTIEITSENTDFISNSKVNGNRGNDTLTLDLRGQESVATTFNGGQGDDIIDASTSTVGVIADGDDDDDTITGGTEGDALYGGDGDDSITGGASADTMSGEGGDNVFIYTGGDAAEAAATFTGTITATTIDVITDFVTGDDQIDMTVAGTGNFTAAGGGVASFAAADAAADAALSAASQDYYLAAYGSGSSWTAVLFMSGGTATVGGAIQIGETNAYASAAAALASIGAADIVT